MQIVRILHIFVGEREVFVQKFTFHKRDPSSRVLCVPPNPGLCRKQIKNNKLTECIQTPTGNTRRPCMIASRILYLPRKTAHIPTSEIFVYYIIRARI